MAALRPGLDSAGRCGHSGAAIRAAGRYRISDTATDRRRRRSKRRISDGEIGDLCRRLLGETPSRIERPGGRSRQSIRVVLRERSIFVTRRKYPARAALEAAVMVGLNREKAPVPEMLAFDGEWLLQSDLGGARLSEVLFEAGPERADTLLRAAVESLAQVQQAGNRAVNQKDLVVLGDTARWCRDLAGMPQRIGRYFDLPPPALDLEAIAARLAVRKAHFVKWDARPGNAIVTPEDEVCWIDWEHCGRRNRLDDMAWLLGDEFTPFDPVRQPALLAHAVARCETGAGDEGAADLALFGVFHSCVRLGLIFSNKEDGPWWDAGYCLATDRIGVTRAMAERLCRRGQYWAGLTDLTAPLGPWFARIAEALPVDDGEAA